MDEHVETLSDSSTQVDAINDPIKETHVVNRSSTLSIVVGSIEQAVIGIIGEGSTQLSTNLVTNVLTNSSKELFMMISSPLNTFKSKAFVVGSHDESMEGNRYIICMPRDSRNIRGDHSSIDSPRTNKDIFCPRIDTTSTLLKDVDNIGKFDTHVHRSATQGRNLELSCIEEVGVNSIFPEIRKEFNCSVQVILVNYILIKIPKFISVRHPNVETSDIQNIDFVTSTKART